MGCPLRGTRSWDREAWAVGRPARTASTRCTIDLAIEGNSPYPAERARVQRAVGDPGELRPEQVERRVERERRPERELDLGIGL